VSYDTPQSISKKIGYITDNNLGGFCYVMLSDPIKTDKITNEVQKIFKTLEHSLVLPILPRPSHSQYNSESESDCECDCDHSENIYMDLDVDIDIDLQSGQIRVACIKPDQL
jgi:hypothetical protein